MEHVKISIDADLYDEVVQGGPPECGDLELVIKEGATVSGAPGVAITFTVQFPDGRCRVQAVTTLRALLGGISALADRYPNPQ